MKKPSKEDYLELIFSAKSLTDRAETAGVELEKIISASFTALGCISPEATIIIIGQLQDYVPQLKQLIKERDQAKEEFLLEHDTAPRTKGH